MAAVPLTYNVASLDCGLVVGARPHKSNEEVNGNNQNHEQRSPADPFLLLGVVAIEDCGQSNLLFVGCEPLAGTIQKTGFPLLQPYPADVQFSGNTLGIFPTKDAQYRPIFSIGGKLEGLRRPP